MVTEKIIEVEKYIETIKEIEKIVYRDKPDGMSQESFVNIWNSLFQLKGISNSEFLSE